MASRLTPRHLPSNRTDSKPQPATVASTAPNGAATSRLRDDIQGLRGIAVLLVVLYHADLGFSGGFIGVDVFFVISGFVITLGLHRELRESGTIRFRRFYARRARRLLPAFAVTSIVVLVLSLLVLESGGEQQRAAITAISASLFFANVALYQGDNDYFGPGDDTNPFLHTWSLSVEEQFYILLPATIFVLWRVLSRRRDGGSTTGLVAACLGVGALASLIGSLVLTETQTDLASFPLRMAFYGMPFRVWEFAAGVILALLANRLRVPPGRWAVGLAAAATAAVVVPALVYTDQTIFPGATAILPVAGTAALIAVGTSRPEATRAFGWRPLTRIGDVSYGWYLLHWPLIVFAAKVWPSSRPAILIAALLSFPLSLALYHAIEMPIRHCRRATNRQTVQLAAGCIAIPVVLAVAVGASGRLGLGPTPPIGRDDSATPIAIENDCIIESVTATGVEWNEQDCLFPADAATGLVLLLGDSHAASISDAVVGAGHRQDLSVAVWSRATCPFVGRSAPSYAPCRAWQDDALDLVEELRPRIVVIANRSPAYVYPDTGADSPLGPIGLADGSATDDRAEALDSWETGLAETVDALTESGSTVLVITTVPEFPPGSFANSTILRPDPTPPIVSRRVVEDRRGEVTGREAAVAESRPSVSTFDPADALCDDTCRAGAGDVWWYSDNHHLNGYGSELLVDSLARKLQTLVDES